MNLGHVLPQVVLLVGAVAALVAALAVPRRLQWIGAPIALASLAGASTAQVQLLGAADQLTLEGLWSRDAATGLATIIVCATTAMVVLLTPEWMATDPRRGEYHAVLLLGALGAVVMAGAADLNELVVGVLLSSVTGYVLAAYHRRSALSVEAGMTYFLVGALSNLVLLIGVVLTFAAGGTTRYVDLGGPLGDADPVLVVGAVSAMTVGLAFKAGAVPAHSWVPDVAQGAPLPSAAFLTVVPKVGATVALARWVDLLPPDGGATPAVAAVAAATMTLGNLAALRQDDVRRLLGWSAVSQAGYAMVAVAAVGASDRAMPLLLVFLATYAAANVAAFGVVGALRGRTRLEHFHGLVHVRPVPAWAMTIALLSLAGVPPLAGFAGKLGIFTAALDADLAWLAVLTIVNTVVSLAYYLRVIAAMHLRDSDRRPVHLLGTWTDVGTGLAGLATVLLGVLAGIVLEPSWERLLLP